MVNIFQFLISHFMLKFVKYFFNVLKPFYFPDLRLLTILNLYCDLYVLLVTIFNISPTIFAYSTNNP